MSEFLNNHSSVMKNIASGNFVPDIYLSNVAMTYFQRHDKYVARELFPVVPVALESSYYYIFDKGALLRDDFAKKPSGGLKSWADVRRPALARRRAM